MSDGQGGGQLKAGRREPEQPEEPARRGAFGVRYLRPSVAVFTLALLASLCVHLPIYEALGKLADVMARAPAAIKDQFIELELAPLGEDDATVKESQRVDRTDPKQAEPEPPQPLPEPPDPQELAKKDEPQPVRPEPEPDPKAVEVVYEEAPTKHAIDQKSDNPDAPPPPDARFSAEENRSVLEETVATARNMHRDDTPQSGASAEQATEEERAGDAAEDEVADLRNVEGEDERAPDVVEAEHRPMQASEPSAGTREAPAVTAAAESSQAPSERVTPQQATGAPETGGEPEPLVVDDGSGRFVIRSVPVGKGPDNQGGDQDPGRPTPHRHSHAGSRQQQGLDLALSWSQFEQTFGSEQLQAQRQAYLEQKRSHAAGYARKENWRKFRSAIENFVPYVRPGNQTALNAAASPFASYIAAVHRKIHREFAFKFLRELPLAGGPFGDLGLHTKLEIAINADGSLHNVGVVSSSGFLPFDFGAFNSVGDAAPFPKPPRSILSGDGRAYVHWGFYRNERACGTFNATPFIMPNPPGTPRPDKRQRPPGDSAPVPIDSDYGWRAPAAPQRHAQR